MTDTAHTPTPWASEYIGDKLGLPTERPTIALVGDHRIVMDGNGARGYDLHGEDKDDAEFIVRAVNSHDAMLAALAPFAEAAGEFFANNYNRSTILWTIYREDGKEPIYITAGHLFDARAAISAATPKD